MTFQKNVPSCEYSGPGFGCFPWTLLIVWGWDLRMIIMSNTYNKMIRIMSKKTEKKLEIQRNMDRKTRVETL